MEDVKPEPSKPLQGTPYHVNAAGKLVRQVATNYKPVPIVEIAIIARTGRAHDGEVRAHVELMDCPDMGNLDKYLKKPGFRAAVPGDVEVAEAHSEDVAASLEEQARKPKEDHSALVDAVAAGVKAGVAEALSRPPPDPAPVDVKPAAPPAS